MFQRAFLVFLLAWVTPVGAAAPFDTPATYALIMDYETGAALFEKNADEPTAPASMSKLMTVAIVFDKIKRGELSPSDEFYVSEK
ncbi:MAG: serine hydrolase, partial [Pseudomonadota bacterium]